MDGTSRYESSSEAGIPSGLNPIKTRRIPSKDQPSSKLDESTESPSFGASRPSLKQKQRTMAHGRGKASGSSGKGLRLLIDHGSIGFCFSVKPCLAARKMLEKKKKIIVRILAALFPFYLCSFCA